MDLNNSGDSSLIITTPETSRSRNSFQQPQQQSSKTNSSIGKNRTNQLFQLTKCPACQIQVTEKDFHKHKNKTLYNYCKDYIEAYYQLQDERNKSKIFEERPDLFENSFLLANKLLYSSTVTALNKDKIKNGLEFLEQNVQTSKQNLQQMNLILLSPQLMSECNLQNGDYVSIFNLTDHIDYGYALIESFADLKHCLAIGVVKDSTIYRKMLNPTKKIVLKIRLCVHTNRLQLLHLKIDREFSDPIAYLQVCALIRTSSSKKIIDPNETILSIDGYEMKILNRILRNESTNEDPSGSILANHFNSLEISRKKQQPDEIKEIFDQAQIIDEETEIIFSPIKSFQIDHKFEGYRKQFQLLEQIVINPLQNRENRSKHIPKTVLLTGPTGTGKTFAMQNLLKNIEGRMNMIVIPSALLLSKSFEFDKLNRLFENLLKLQPSLLFMDNLEDVSNEKNQLEKRLISLLKYFFDDLPRNQHIIVIGATNRPEQLEMTLRRPGRFDVEIDFPIPSVEDRKLLFHEIIKQFDHSLDENQIDELARSAHGYTCADIQSLLRAYLLEQSHRTNCIDNYELIARQLHRTRPSAMREIVLESPNVHWKEIGGMREIKKLLEMSIVWPHKNPKAFQKMNIEPPKGLLMFGPPGCCKTMIGKAIATESGMNFFSIKGPELFSKWVGESERSMREIFTKARAASPSIIFFDEIDSLASERGSNQSAVGDRVLAQFRNNRPDIIDKALLRPGRLDAVVYVPLPNLETRTEIFKINMEKMPINLDGSIFASIESLADHLSLKTEGYSGAEIKACCHRAALSALNRNIESELIEIKDLEESIHQIRPQTSSETIRFYEEFSRRYNFLRASLS
ncbi:ATPase family -like protein [Sarcoptes scabiei]|uniref:Spermatogenesis-associated protein 5 n=1 Tax=Sarcoptes scabiei TaxID=52283 RepID=A0A834R6F0_SARSC|nr:ATPase family -like protein [Sarcoptes scabiei]